jgi:16S rRNA (guanine527-N7)-methyltransferase
MNFDPRPFFKSINLTDADSFLKQSKLFYELLIEENKKTNLTRITNTKEYWIKHILDSIIIVNYFPDLAKNNLSVADIGCGPGFPSIPLALAYPNLEITAIDSAGKKINFIKSVISRLKIDNLKAVNGRARELNRKKEWKELFDVITARAVSEGKNIHRETKNMLKNTGSFIFYKTPEQASGELPEIIKSTQKTGITWKKSEFFELPENSGKRLFLYSEKS